MVETLDKAGTQRGDTSELKLEHGAQVHLRRLGGIADCTHTGRPFVCSGPTTLHRERVKVT
ncbi:hypothetical protein acdb102_08500 [Acidothermaceae bacterium B102]|nr:hypothetical protein acdb102_08500 [Acidothermaceae bacterium B102]